MNYEPLLLKEAIEWLVVLAIIVGLIWAVAWVCKVFWIG